MPFSRFWSGVIKGQAHLVPDRATVCGFLRQAFVLKDGLCAIGNQMGLAGQDDALSLLPLLLSV